MQLFYDRSHKIHLDENTAVRAHGDCSVFHRPPVCQELVGDFINRLVSELPDARRVGRRAFIYFSVLLGRVAGIDEMLRARYRDEVCI